MNIQMHVFSTAVIGALFVAAVIPRAMAQTAVKFAYDVVADGNAFRNYENLADIIHQPQLSISRDHTGGKGGVQFFYQGSAFLFTEYRLRNYHSHSLGITGQRWGDDGRQIFSWGIQGGQRFNKTEYQYYDYQHADAFMNFQFDRQNGRIWLLGAQARYRRNSQLSAFDYLETLAFLRGSFFFKTRTTMIGRVQAGYKAFTESVINESWIETVTGSGQQGRGKGRGNPVNTDTLYQRVVVEESPQDGVFQLTGSLRLAQSLGTRTGLAAEYTMQVNLEGGSRVLSGQDGGYEVNDELFDDPYSYDMQNLSITLTQLLPMQCRLKMEAVIGNKVYARPVYGIDEDEVTAAHREDSVRLWGGVVSKTFQLGTGRSLLVSLEYANVENDSNDAYYRYRSVITRLGFDIKF